MHLSISAAIVILLLIGSAAYCIYKKNFPVFFVCIYALLPDYLSFEISGSLPLVTMGRIMFAILFLYTFWQKRSGFTLKQLFSTYDSLPLLAYFALKIVTNLYYLFTYSDATKTIIDIVCEEACILFLFVLLFSTKEEIETALKAFVYSSGIVFYMAISESLTGINLGQYLYTTTRTLLNEQYIRLGLLRSEFTFGMPAFFATYCILVIPLILYFYEKAHQKRFLFLLGMDFFALIHSGCRAHMLFGGFLICILWIFSSKDQKIPYLKAYAKVAVVSLILITVLSCVSSHLRYYYIGTGKSLLNEVGFDFDLNEGAPEGTAGYGENQDGTYSRTVQFSGIRYALGINPLFGLGANAQNRGQIHYLWKKNWRPAHTYDVGYVAVVADGGLIGASAYLIFILYLIMTLRKKWDPLNKTFAMIFMGYGLCLLANNLTTHLFYLYFASFYAYNKMDNKKDMA